MQFKQAAMMSFLKKLFGGGKAAESTGETGQQANAVDYKGCTITPTPKAEGGQFRVAGVIAKEIGGTLKTHAFIRADVFSDRDEAIAAIVRKAQLIIDQSGDAIFGGQG
jgi:hypothetical protein